MTSDGSARRDVHPNASRPVTVFHDGEPDDVTWRLCQVIGQALARTRKDAGMNRCVTGGLEVNQQAKEPLITKDAAIGLKAYSNASVTGLPSSSAGSGTSSNHSAVAAVSKVFTAVVTV